MNESKELDLITNRFREFIEGLPKEVSYPAIIHVILEHVSAMAQCKYRGKESWEKYLRDQLEFFITIGKEYENDKH